MAKHGHTAEAFVLHCMDYRLTGAVTRYLESRGLAGAYDQMVLAGATLGVVAGAYPEWKVTFWQTLELSLQLHKIGSVIVIDHRDCGLYRAVLARNFARDPALETAVHREWQRKLQDQIAVRYPNLTSAFFLMALDGSVEQTI